MKTLKCLFTACVVVTLVLSFSCRSNSPSTVYDPIHELQSEVPFTIVVPKYFPKDIRTLPDGIAGPGFDPTTQTVEIGITYRGKRTDGLIWIIEQNQEKTIVSSNDAAIQFVIGNVSVHQEPYGLSSFGITGEPGTIVGLLFTWNRDGINFEVLIFGYERDEAFKVIESMIK